MDISSASFLPLYNDVTVLHSGLLKWGHGSFFHQHQPETGIPLYCTSHKVRTYKEYHSVCPSSELGLSQPLSRQRVCPSPQKQGGGSTLACGWGVGGSPKPDEGHTLWYSLYVRTLWYQHSKYRTPTHIPTVCLSHSQSYCGQ
jgi:hypothetical protein